MGATLLDSGFAEAVERSVTAIEAGTDAEIVVVAARRSGSYRDTAVIVGAIAGLAVLTFVVFSPWAISPTLLPLEIALIGIVVGWLFHGSPTAIRLLTSTQRRQQQVLAAAQQAFLDEAVHGTRGRTGLLVYLSTLERRALLLPDLGLDARIARGRWTDISWSTARPDAIAVDGLEGFLHGLDQVGAILAVAIPPIDDNPDEIANRPRIRP